MVKKKWSEYVWCTCEVEYAHTGARTEPKQKHAVYIALTVQRVSLMNDTATSHVEIQLFRFFGVPCRLRGYRPEQSGSQNVS